MTNFEKGHLTSDAAGSLKVDSIVRGGVEANRDSAVDTRSDNGPVPVRRDERRVAANV